MSINIEEEVIAYLKSEGFQAFAVPPKNRPKRFITVEEVGRKSLASGFVAEHTVTLTAWAETLYRASSLLNECENVMSLYDTPWLTRVREGSRYRFVSVDNEPRYQAAFFITENL